MVCKEDLSDYVRPEPCVWYEIAQREMIQKNIIECTASLKDCIKCKGKNTECKSYMIKVKGK